MTKRFPLVLFALGTFLLPSPPLLHAQTPTPPPATAPALDELIKQLGIVDENLDKKVLALRELIDTEAIANRVPEPVAQSLRWSLRNILTTNSTDFNNVISYTRLPVENATLMSAIRDLETEWGTGQSQRAAIIKSSVDRLQRDMAALFRTAEKPTDLDPLIATASELQRAMPPRTSGNQMQYSVYPIDSMLSFLRAFRRVLEAREGGNPVMLASALFQLRSPGSSVRTMIGEEEISNRTQRELAPFQQKLDETQAALDRQIRDERPAAELTASLTRLEEAADRNQEARLNLDAQTRRDPSGILSVYRNLVAVRASLVQGDINEARKNFATLKSSLSNIGTARSGPFIPLVTALEKAMEEEAKKVATKKQDELRARFAAIKQPADLIAFATEISKVENETRNDRDGDFPRGLGAQLNALAAAWISGNPGLLNRQNYDSPTDFRFAAELASLRMQILRDVLGRTLHAPELNQPPLADLPPETALDKLSERLAEKGEWRRLLQLLEARSMETRFDNGMSPDADLIAALRSFLAAQNFELAELWTDAAQAYKMVLRSTNERAPLKQTAERLKAIAREHPEAIRTAGVPNVVPVVP